MRNRIITRSSGDVICEDGVRRCVAMTTDSSPHRCKHIVGPDQIVCGTHMIRSNRRDYVRWYARSSAVVVFFILEDVISGDADALEKVRKYVDSVNVSADEAYKNYLHDLQCAGWSSDEIEKISLKL